jgi:hypothetical protein
LILPLCFLGYGTDNDTYSVLDGVDPGIMIQDTRDRIRYIACHDRECFDDHFQ